ncbi:MAG: efflux transporter outer membrane subunit [Pseudomonadota bacterium]|nr:efflux transporter outer membrane subunit [Pseudomonadota bacterium]
MTRSPAARWVVACTGLLSLAGCSFAPRYSQPAVHTTSYTHAPSPHATVSAIGPSGQAQQFDYGASPVAKWWRQFHSPQIDTLIRQALANNPGLVQEQAKLRQAQAAMAAAAGIFYPQVTGDLGASRQRTSSAGSGGSFPGRIYSLYSGGLAVSYYPDFFGVNRLVFKGEKALVDYQRYQLDAARLTLIGNVAAAAISAASVRAQIVATRSIIAHEKSLLKLTETQYHFGAVPYLSVLTQRSQVASSEASLPSLEQQSAVYRHELAILVGELPAQWRDHSPTMSDVQLPVRIPVSLPSTLLKQRPDIRAAEAQVRYADVEIGVAKARMYPVVTLTAQFGQESTAPGAFLHAASNIWSVAGDLAMPIFAGGTLEAQKREAIASYDATFAAYRQTVLGAFQQVANALRALQHDAQTLRAEQHALAANRAALQVAETSYRDGAVDYLSLLTAEVQYNNARLSYIQAQSQRYLDTVSLFVALGGSWTAQLPAAQSHPAAQSRGTSRMAEEN